MNNGSPTPRRYTSRPDFKNYGFDGLENRDNGSRYMNPREKLIPKQYYENARTVDELLAEIKMLSRQLREQQERELKLRNLCETLKGKLGKYFEFRELALRYKHERDELSYKLYKKNIYEDDDDNINNSNNNNNVKNFDFIDDSDVNKDLDDNHIYISKRRNNHYKNNEHRSSMSTNKSDLDQNGNDLETKELISKLYEMISSLKQDSITLSTQSNSNNCNNTDDNNRNSNGDNMNNDSNKNNNTEDKSKYLSEKDLDVIKTEELKKLEDAVQEYRHRLEARKAYERRKISAQQEILQIQEELRGLDTGFSSFENNNTSNTRNSVKFAEKETKNEVIRPKSKNKSKIRERFDDIGNEYDETSFFQTSST